MSLPSVRVLRGVTPDSIPFAELMEAGEPVLLKGVARDWPLVKKGLQSPAAAIDYLGHFHNGLSVAAYFGGKEMRGRYFYNPDLTGLNFTSRRLPLDEVLAMLAEQLDEREPWPIYVGSTTVDACLPGLREKNDFEFSHPMFSGNAPLASIWIGNHSIASAHYDAPHNLACCAVGRRRFTLFPPDQIENLYPGPLSPTPGGQAVSMVDFAAPDFDKYPRFKEALATAQVAEMEPGDAVFYPSLWWHQVEALDRFNVLLNYWWQTSARFMDTPMNTVLHALLSLRDRPPVERDAWKAIFDFYIFSDPEKARAHLPEHVWGALGPLDEAAARKLRAMLINKLNR
ncbi:cupin-like domain-containing protein [Microbulbifer sp. YPW1]|nr:cupin-like domain-containing protein [Microbulbifer sp. YPW1]